jgi:hypothetical protein
LQKMAGVEDNKRNKGDEFDPSILYAYMEISK